MSKPGCTFDDFDGDDCYTIDEFAKLVSKQPYTVREWCRFNWILASKRRAAKSRAFIWLIPRSELERYRAGGLRPDQ